jgi:hypothetical protein
MSQSGNPPVPLRHGGTSPLSGGDIETFETSTAHSSPSRGGAEGGGVSGGAYREGAEGGGVSGVIPGQHMGMGKKMLEKCEDIVREKYRTVKKIAVIS